VKVGGRGRGIFYTSGKGSESRQGKKGIVTLNKKNDHRSLKGGGGIGKRADYEGEGLPRRGRGPHGRKVSDGVTERGRRGWGEGEREGRWDGVREKIRRPPTREKKKDHWES